MKWDIEWVAIIIMIIIFVYLEYNYEIKCLEMWKEIVIIERDWWIDKTNCK